MEYIEKEHIVCYAGKKIYGKLLLPRGGEGKYPLLICSHGFNSSYSDLMDMAKKAAENGIAVYSFDYCGGGVRSKSTGETVDMSVASEQEDLRAVIDNLSKLDFICKDKIFIFGESQGGFVAALTAAETGKRIRGLFLLYPAFCIPDQWLSIDIDSMKHPFKFMGGVTLSKAYYDGVPRYDVYEHISKYPNFVRIWHGDSDKIVDLSYSDRLYETYKSVTLTIIKGQGHGFKPETRAEIAEDMCGQIEAVCQLK